MCFVGATLGSVEGGSDVSTRREKKGRRTTARIDGRPTWSTCFVQEQEGWPERLDEQAQVKSVGGRWRWLPSWK